MSKTKRINLLLVHNRAEKLSPLSKLKGKFRKNSYLLETSDTEEARGLLDRLHIDLLIVDLDSHSISFTECRHLFPKLTVLGATWSQRRQSFLSEFNENKVILKTELEKALLSEIRSIRKEKELA